MMNMEMSREDSRGTDCFDEDSSMEVLDLGTDRFLNAPQPFDGNWQYDETAAEMTIFRMGKFSFSRFLPAFFFTILWNAFTVTHFLMFLTAFQEKKMDFGFEQWVLFLFYVPFVLVGIGLFGGLGVLLFSSKIRETWIITRKELRHEKKLFCFRRTRKLDVSKTERLEIECDSLWFVDREEEECFAFIDELTREEARWIASRFQMLH